MLGDEDVLIHFAREILKMHDELQELRKLKATLPPDQMTLGDLRLALAEMLDGYPAPDFRNPRPRTCPNTGKKGVVFDLHSEGESLSSYGVFDRCNGSRRNGDETLLVWVKKEGEIFVKKLVKLTPTGKACLEDER